MSKDRQRGHAPKDDRAAIGDRTNGSECPVIVVGIGASAGGLKSLTQLFAKVPLGHRVAFVLIQHLDPSRKSRTVELLRDRTALAVVEATEGMPVLADRIHVMPPGKFLNITGARLSLPEPVYCDGLRLPIDHFFCALAVDQRQRACGIVLSGTGSDGTVGLSEIKAAGGRTLVEDPGSAEYPDMPQSAIDAGAVDAVLPAEGMAEAIVARAKQVAEATRNEPSESPEFDADLRAVLDILRAKVGYDFRCYKPTTLVRRIRRRMTLAKVATFADYGRFLREHPDEVRLLQKDLLIGVTEFFRQTRAWEVLEERVIAAVVENARPGSEIRVWVPGCSTGQEAYSLAMLLHEQVEKSGKQVDIQIFATDSDPSPLATARTGSYSEEEIGENVSAERLKRFFARKDGRYQVIKKVRERVVFAPQNITADPPFSRLDLISCRNLFIYLDQQVQRKIIALFHFALREGGFLFLGTAETVGDREDLFEAISKKWRIYRRIGVGRPVGVEIPVCPTGQPPWAPGKLPIAASLPKMGLALTAQQVLQERFAPACVMIDRKLHVLYVHGAVEDYLTFPPGELTTRVVDMARDGLRARLRGGVTKCLEVGRSVSVTARVRRGEKSVPVKATVSPLRYPKEADGLLLITFEDYRVSAAKSRRQRAAGESAIQQLEDELKVTREELQSTIEQLESSNDQLKASNEEGSAANEELQSANEELETSKEELQSLNEELNTINARLQEKVDELESTNNDVVNLLSSTNIATVFLDRDLKVKRYTPAMTRLLSLIPSDVGRPIVDVLRRFRDETLLDDTARVLADLTPLAKEVQANDGRWYIRRITPYRTQDDRIEGVVVTFVDVSDLKETDQALRRSEAQLQTILENLTEGLVVADIEGRLFQWNQAALEMHGFASLDEARRRLPEFADVFELATMDGNVLPVDEWPLARILRGEELRDWVLRVRRPNSDWQRIFSYGGTLVRDVNRQPLLAVLSVRDITERKLAEDSLQVQMRLMEFAATHSLEEILQKTLDEVGEITESPIGFYHFVEDDQQTLSLQAWSTRTVQEFCTAQGKGSHYSISDAGVWADCIHQRRPVIHNDYTSLPHRKGMPEGHAQVTRELVVPILRRGHIVAILGVGNKQSEYTEKDVELVSYLADMAWEIAERNRAEAALRESEERLNRAQEIAHLGSWELDLVNNRLTWSDEVYRIFGLEPQEFGATYEAFLEAVHPDDRAAVDAAYSGSLRDDRDSYEIEHRVVRRSSGEVRLIHEKCEHLRDGSGRIIRSMGMVHDITERKAAEQALRQSEKRYRSYIELTEQVGWTTNADGEVVEDIPSWRKFTGQSEEEVKGWGWSKALHPDDLEHTARVWRNAVATRNNYDTEYRIRRYDGAYRYFLARGVPVFEEDGNIQEWVGTCIDITERKRAEEVLRASEEALRQANEQLEERVRERTAELRALMEDLEKSRDDLRKLASKLVLAEEQERKRISVVLHDEVAQTLAAARTRLELLRNLPCNEDFRQSVTEAQELIGQSIRETRALMTDISSPALYEMGLRSAVETLAGEITARHGLPVACSFEGSPWSLDPDLRVMLFQVVKELMQNVVKHSRARNASIRIVEEKDSIRVVVADNGQGFDARNLGSPGFEGGFGLFSIRERVHFFNGDIAIQSNPGAGTEVMVVLPKAAGNHKPAKEAKEREGGKTDPTCS
jgi:two-component system CheB/CheR fusion protein